MTFQYLIAAEADAMTSVTLQEAEAEMYEQVIVITIDDVPVAQLSRLDEGDRKRLGLNESQAGQ